MMNYEQIKLLTKMKKLIKLGRRRFALRHDRNYLQDLFDIGIFNEDDAWNIILTLNNYCYYHDKKSNYYKDNNCLVFKRKINNNFVYIKIKIEILNNYEETVCLSFRKDFKGSGKNDM